VSLVDRKNRRTGGENGPAASGRGRLSTGSLALALLVIISATAVRIPLLANHFGHIDDLAVAVAIIDAKAHPVSLDQLVEEAQRKVRQGRPTARIAMLLRLSQEPGVASAWRFLEPVYPLVVVPLKMTYAPLQFLLTGAILRPGAGYDEVKLWGRLPSLIASIATLALLAPLSKKLSPQTWTAHFLAAASVIGFSIEYSIMSAQMHAYAAAATATCALMLVLAAFQTRDASPGARGFWCVALLPALLCYLSYQTVLLLPGFYAALVAAVLAERRTAGRGRSLLGVGLAAVVAGALVAPAYFLRIRSVSAIGWNAGPSGEFLMPHKPGPIGGPVEFLVHNGWTLVQAMTSPILESSPALPIFTVFVLVICGVGALTLLRALRPATWSPRSSVGVLIFVSLLVVLALVAAGLLTLSPTRHFVFILPIAAVLFASGICSTAEVLDKGIGRGVPHLAAWAVAAAFSGAYFASYPDLMAQRRDAFDEPRLAALAAAQKPDFVIGYDATLQPLLMPRLRAVAPVMVLEDIPPPAGARSSQPATTLLLVSHRGPFTEADCAFLAGRFGFAPTGQCLASLGAVVLEARPSAVEVEFSPRTSNGTNGFFATRLTLPARSADGAS
jgi:hypothetical protein